MEEGTVCGLRFLDVYNLVSLNHALRSLIADDLHSSFMSSVFAPAIPNLMQEFKTTGSYLSSFVLSIYTPSVRWSSLHSPSYLVEYLYTISATHSSASQHCAVQRTL